MKKIGKREFIQHTSKYLKYVEGHRVDLVITHQNEPALILSLVKPKTFGDLKGTVQIKIHGDINAPVLPGYDEW